MTRTEMHMVKGPWLRCMYIAGAGFAPKPFKQTYTDIFSFHVPILASICPPIHPIIPLTECKRVKKGCLEDVKA